MDILFDQTGLHFLLRWVHFMAGITWIGMLYYFNFVQTPFFKSAEGPVKGAMTQHVVPVALWWFRWGAMFTFLSGLGLIELSRHMGNDFSSAYMTLILTGGLMGTLMWFNVWFIIWPAQKLVIASAQQTAGGGEAIPEAAARGAKAGMASRTNTLLSIPMLFFMGAASHLSGLAGDGSGSLQTYWIVTVVVILLIEANGLIGPGKPTQKALTSVSGTITAGFVVTAILFLIATKLL